MGLPMAVNVAQSGEQEVSVLAYDTLPDPCDGAVRGGSGNIQIASSIAEIAQTAATDTNCDVIFTMLPGCAVVNNVMTEILDNLQTEKSVLFVDCSTVAPTTSRTWHERCRESGHAFVDAPVSGGVKGATDATLTFMMGCRETDVALARARPFLEKMGRRLVPCGGPGAGSVVKLCNNLALAAQMVGICEALNLGDALGVDPVVLAEVMNTSTAKCWSSEVNNPHPVVAASMSHQPPASRDYQGGFGVALMLKDLGLAAEAAEQTGVAVPLTVAGKELYKIAAMRGMGDKDFGVMLQFLRGM
jgi:3-hydroxyisobutyrate dehydrogenase